MAWTDESVSTLKELWSEGLSASQIAARMPGVSRNAVIGKVHRLGLSGRATPAKPTRGCVQKASAKPIQGPTQKDLLCGTAAVDAANPVDQAFDQPEFITPVTFESGEHVTVVTLQKNMCKWPVGDPQKDDFHYCGGPTNRTGSYCPYHASMAFQSPQQRREQNAYRRTQRAAAHQ